MENYNRYLCSVCKTEVIVVGVPTPIKACNCKDAHIIVELKAELKAKTDIK